MTDAVEGDNPTNGDKVIFIDGFCLRIGTVVASGHDYLLVQPNGDSDFTNAVDVSPQSVSIILKQEQKYGRAKKDK